MYKALRMSCRIMLNADITSKHLVDVVMADVGVKQLHVDGSVPFNFIISREMVDQSKLRATFTI